MTKRIVRDPDHHVAYIRIPVYYRQFLVSRYGNHTPSQDIPTVFFPLTSPYHDVITHYLVDNSTFRRLCNNSYCDIAFNYSPLRSDILEADIAVPPTGLKHEFMAIGIPDRVYKGNMVYETSSAWQLNSSGMAEFNRMIKREYWRECLSFIDDCAVKAKIERRSSSRENAISDFMMTYDIPMDLLENMIRYEKRFRKAMIKEIKSRRDNMEKMNDVEMFYTR